MTSTCCEPRFGERSFVFTPSAKGGVEGILVDLSVPSGRVHELVVNHLVVAKTATSSCSRLAKSIVTVVWNMLATQNRKDVVAYF